MPNVHNSISDKIRSPCHLWSENSDIALCTKHMTQIELSTFYNRQLIWQSIPGDVPMLQKNLSATISAWL